MNPNPDNIFGHLDCMGKMPGSDCPTVTVRHLLKVFQELQDKDAIVVFSMLGSEIPRELDIENVYSIPICGISLGSQQVCLMTPHITARIAEDMGLIERPEAPAERVVFSEGERDGGALVSAIELRKALIRARMVRDPEVTHVRLTNAQYTGLLEHCYPSEIDWDGPGRSRAIGYPLVRDETVEFPGWRLCGGEQE